MTDIVLKKTNGAKGAVVSKVSEVSEGKKMNGTNMVTVEGTVAFKPFENYIFDMRGLLGMLDDLTLIERSLFRGKEATISMKARDFTSSAVIGIFEDLEKTGMEPVGDSKQLNFLKDLVEYLKKLPVVRVTLAFSPTNTYLQSISNSISSFSNKKTLLDLTVDEHIVGGAIFEYGGKVSGNSLEARLDEVLSKQISGSKS